MDLGGASTQITFETASPVEDPASEVQLWFYGQPYRVYTHSFLCYGRDQVLLRLLAGALQVPHDPPARLHHCALLEGGGEKRGEPGVQSRAWTEGPALGSRSPSRAFPSRTEAEASPRHKCQAVGVGLDVACLGRKEGQGWVSKGLAGGRGASAWPGSGGELSSGHGESRSAPEHRSNVAHVGLTGDSPGRSSGEAQQRPRAEGGRQSLAKG